MNEFTIMCLFPSEEDFGTDVWGYQIYLNGEMLMSYGDDYHGKGKAKSIGFINGYVKASDDIEDYTIKYENKVEDESKII